MALTSRTSVASLLRELPRIILLVLFSFAAVDKLIHFRGFANAVQSYHLLPAKVEYSAAIFFIIAEFAIALGLLMRRWRRPASLAAVLLLAIFTTAYMVARPAGVCGCWFTLTLNSGGAFHILQNLVFIGLAVLTWLDNLSPSTKSESSIGLIPKTPFKGGVKLDDGGPGHVRLDFERKEVGQI